MYCMNGVVSSTKNASKQGVLTNKLVGCKTYFKVFLGNPAHTNWNIPSNLYWAKVWFILLEERSQGPTPKVTSSTEMKSNCPLNTRHYTLQNARNFTLDTIHCQIPDNQVSLTLYCTLDSILYSALYTKQDKYIHSTQCL